MQFVSNILPLTRGIAASRALAAGASFSDISPLLVSEFGIGLAYGLLHGALQRVLRRVMAAFDPGLRITIDARLMYRPAPVDIGHPFSIGSYIVDPRVAVLEIKYDHQAPGWLTKIVCRYGLKIVRLSKYCSAVDLDRSGGQNT